MSRTHNPSTAASSILCILLAMLVNPFIVNSTIGEVLRQEIKNTGSSSTVLFLGDNIYPKGMPDPDHKKRECFRENIRDAG